MPHIPVTTFAVVNLLTGLIVSAMQSAHAAEEVAATEACRDEAPGRLRAIEARLTEAGRGGDTPAATDAPPAAALEPGRRRA